jgi:cytochrome c oxidase subunit 2
VNNLLGLPLLASAQGGRIDATLLLVHLLMLVLFVGWGAFFVYCLFRFRSSRQPLADRRGVRGHLPTQLEFAVAGVEAALLVGFSIPIWSQRVDDFPDEKEATVVHIISQQFAWNCHYAGPDGVFGRLDPGLISADNPIGLDREVPGKDDLILVNQLHLPVGKPAILDLSSMDVIHCFYLPEMRVKQDVIPGSVIPVWFVPEITTEEMRKIRIKEGLPEGVEADTLNYEIACAQLCGLGHYQMRGYLTVDTPEEFTEWLAKQQELLASQEDEYEYEEEKP